MKFVQDRVADRRILRLIQKWLKAGVSENGHPRRVDFLLQSVTAFELVAGPEFDRRQPQWQSFAGYS